MSTTDTHGSVQMPNENKAAATTNTGCTIILDPRLLVLHLF